ncbi:hypothetical protein DYBT9275_00426 [Dyadobacter sp. CECT 9275]|uniref:Heme oxygenase n=1 Tax=Dyadobacter helix TaxID=2822344 RepID=A0A916NJL6_9BACT|nr:biliverdin-producing heme oxygenase [Dyadobacter sp. CECT 9275]CAG4990007.1 hypothetical protein DYBT9275_00426 [Dyadobacter sp. CECT 9275]
MNELTISHEVSELFLQNLRLKTSLQHKLLEENTLSKAILDSGITIATYQRYLMAMYRVVKGVELTVFEKVQYMIPEINRRRKSHLIIDDLSQTGLSLVSIHSLSPATFLPQNLAEALGILYVVEGSTLGGRLIYKHVQKNLALDATNGASFFKGYGPETGSRWKSFIAALCEFAVTTHSEAEIIDSAAATFSAIDLLLKEAEN